jgi:MazG family protein
MYENHQLPHLTKLIEVVSKLRDPIGGCPWDLKQTHQSLLKYLIEESYEFIQAVEDREVTAMEEELGDVFLQVLLHAVIAEQSGHFNLESVCKRLAEKLIFRHPHVFGETVVKDEQEVVKNWNQLKQIEKNQQGLKESEIDKSYLMLPALMSAQKIGEKTHQLKFDWDNADQIFEKIDEEWQEFKNEKRHFQQLKPEKMKEELGDFLFTIVQLSRHLKIDAEDCLRQANKKFVHRFQKMENIMKDEGVHFGALSQSELDVFWDKVKQQEKKEL